ncbi:hypothetical protein AAEY27_10315 [Kosakonia sp. BYX6]|uniref:Secreted protein n=1 Tax=Kosakonia calanthes TaxID=3139408 RepID=A0ABZ3BCU1_9ENTR
MRNRVIVITLLLTAVGSTMVAANEGEKSCVSVTVNGNRTLPYDCLSQRLLPPKMSEKTSENKGLNALSARQINQPANHLGLFNQSATAVRMGANFGHSAQSQRPSPAPISSPLLTGH